MAEDTTFWVQEGSSTDLYMGTLNIHLRLAYCGGECRMRTKADCMLLAAFVSVVVTLGLVLCGWTSMTICAEPSEESHCATWATATVDSSGVVGEYTSIALDSANGAHISYRDVTNLDLKYAYKPSAGGWSKYTVDSTGNVGAYSSTAIDSAGVVYISHYDWTNYNLKYAYKPVSS